MGRHLKIEAPQIKQTSRVLHYLKAVNGFEDTRTHTAGRNRDKQGEKLGEVALVKKCVYPSNSQLGLLEAEAEEAGGSVLSF